MLLRADKKYALNSITRVSNRLGVLFLSIWFSSFVLAGYPCTAQPQEPAEGATATPANGEYSTVSRPMLDFDITAKTRKPSIPNRQEGETSFAFGWDQRIRNEDSNNMQDLNSATDDERLWTTLRQRLWFQVTPGTPNISLYVRWLNQFAKTTTPDTRLNLDEIIFDNLYLEFRKTVIPGLSLKLGRQDLMKGEGFLIADASSGDGPRTTYFNAADLVFTRKASSFELIGVLDPRQDRFLPIIHNQHRNLNEWDEQAIGFYYTNRAKKERDIDAYYFLKKETHDFRPSTNPQFMPDRLVNTAGGRISQRFPEEISITGEIAYQWGAQHPDTPIRAYGGYAYAKKQLVPRFQPYVLAGYWVLSGANPNHPGTYGGWDPLFSRWPKWSWMYVWTMLPEQGGGYWTNNRMFQTEAGFTPWKPVTLKAVYYRMDAFYPCTKNPHLFGTGTHRGDMPQVIASYKFSDQINGQLRYEMFSPGDFYVGRSRAQYFVFELNYSWKHAIASHPS